MPHFRGLAENVIQNAPGTSSVWKGAFFLAASTEPLAELADAAEVGTSGQDANYLSCRICNRAAVDVSGLHRLSPRSRHRCARRQHGVMLIATAHAVDATVSVQS